MNVQVANFAAVVRNDTRLRGGFNLIGYSQGALIARGYVERYTHLAEYPRVVNLVTWCGPHQGVFGVPVFNHYCPTESALCRLVDEAFDLMMRNRLASFELQHHVSFAGFWKVCRVVRVAGSSSVVSGSLC